LILAALMGHLAVVRCLIELGAKVGAVDSFGDTSLLEGTEGGRYATVHFLLEEAGANMDDVNNNGKSVWNLLIAHLQDVLGDDFDADADDRNVETGLMALTGLLRVMVLRCAPPLVLVALLSPGPARVVQEGARLRARLPAYLVRRRVLLDERCPVLLPPLRALVRGYMELTTTTTTEEL
jgi:hypothetical protein